jgi:hypothetical protein
MNTEHAKEDHSRCWKEKDIVSLIWEHAGITHPKPKKKVIDLSVLIDSQIDCEFKYGGKLTPQVWFVDKLTEIHNEANTYKPSLQGYTTYCRPRMNHIHAWQGGECPLPEGFMVKVWCRDMRKSLSGNRATEFNWTYDSDSREDIIAFEVLGVADGYVMPWESE